MSIWRPLLSLSVHEDLAAAEGTATERVKLVFVVVLALVVAIAIKIVGALLTIAFLIMPAAAARPLARTPEQMAVLAGAFGMLAVAAGLFMSVTLDTPAGPSIVLVLAALFAIVDPALGAAPPAVVFRPIHRMPKVGGEPAPRMIEAAGEECARHERHPVPSPRLRGEG